MIEHNLYIGPPCFPVFNDQELSMEPIHAEDLTGFLRSDTPDMNFAADAAWSSDCEWYFVILPEGIAFFNVFDRRGLLCQRKSAMFIEACLGNWPRTRSPNARRRSRALTSAQRNEDRT